MTFRLPNLRLILRAFAALALLAVFVLAPASVSLSGVAHAQSADPDPTIVNICDRTSEVRDAILGKLPEVSDCADVTASDLSGITDGLDLRGQGIESLQAQDFHGLPNLETLVLSRNSLTGLPENVFDGLSGLERLFLKDNPGAAFTLKAELERQGDDAFVVQVAQGAPFNMAITLSAEGGALSSTAVTIEGGSTTSAPISVTPGSEGQTQVTISVESASFVNYDKHNGIQAGLGEPLVMGDAEPVNRPATGAPTISGTAQVGDTLTADTSAIADADGLSRVTYSYQWVRNDETADTDIPGATGDSYTLVAADEGKTIKVRVTFTDDADNQESLTCEATAVIAARPNSPSTGLPAIDGTAQVGQTLTASTSEIADADGLSGVEYSYQWISNDGTADSDIQGATGGGYTLVDADEGKTVKVRVSFTDDAGHDETLMSAPTAAVRAAVPPASEPAPNLPSDEEPCSGSPSPVEVEVTEVPIVVESTTADYFVLYVRFEVDANTTTELPVSVTLGEAGTTALSENVAPLPAERYKVEKYLVADPADVDGECIDDITELADPVGMSPVNPAANIEFIDGAVVIPDRETYETLSGRENGKIILFGMDTDRPGVYFSNTYAYNHHYLFIDAIEGLEWGEGVVGDVFYYPNLVAPDGSRGGYYFNLPLHRYPFSVGERAYALLAANMPLLDDNLDFWVRSIQIPYFQSLLPLYRESRIGLVFDEDIVRETRFKAMNPGEGYGLLRLMDPDGRPNPREVVIYEALPNEMPRVAGIITTVLQTPLSHVNLRAVQDGIPNAFVRDALDNSDIDDLIGSYVRYTVTEDGWALRAATRAEVDAHYASSRPAEAQTPERDLSVTEITPLGEIGFGDWKAFGVKAANVAVLGKLGFPSGTVPDGFAVPFYFYDEFMKHNGLYEDIEEMLADTDFQTDFDIQESKLKKLRKKIKKSETPQWIITALTEMHGEFTEGTSLRYRSSTNNEDLPVFNGAGLYDSKTQHPEETEEDGVSKSLKQVYASLWNFRAFSERDFHRIDHTEAAMGVLVHPNYSDELANGVAVSFDPIRGVDGSYYVNTQVGEDLVTNPEAHSVPKEILLGQFDSHTVLGTSNQAPSGQLLMSAVQMRQLRQALSTIHDHFKRLYNPASGEPFAMEIEFKITSENVLAIKQARPWVFESTSATRQEPHSTGAMLSGLELSGVALSPAFAADATAYTASVANDVDETTVTPTVNDDDATYAIEIGGTAAAEGVIPLSVGENVVTIEVTGADGETVKTTPSPQPAPRPFPRPATPLYGLTCRPPAR